LSNGQQPPPPDLSPAPLFAAVASVAAGVGGLAASGLLGQIERNHPLAFTCALGATVAGTFLGALAGSGILGDATTDPKRIRRTRGLSAVLVLVGVVLAVFTAVRTASDRGKPVIDVSVAPVTIPGKSDSPTRTYLVDAHTKASNLPAAASVAILVDGLRLEAASETYAPTNVFHGKYGPSNEGTLDIHARVELTRGSSSPPGTRFDAVGVQAAVAFTEEENPTNPCANYQKKVSTEASDQTKARRKLDPGCVVIRLPGPITADG